MESCEPRAQSKLHIGRREPFLGGWVRNRSRKRRFFEPS
jgi:hypothetical protein